MICADTLSGNKSEMTLDQTYAFLEPDAKTGRAGALCRSMADALMQKTALEQACRILGDQCTYELKQTIKTMESLMQ